MQKKVIVTGATDGIGLITARRIAESGAEVGLVARNAAKGAEVIESLKRETGNDALRFFQADLSSFAEVRRVSEEISTAFPKLNVLVNNAGAMFVRRTMSVDGVEMTFALNHLSVFLLTNLLLPQIKAGRAGRVVTVASVAHRGADIDFDDLDSSRARYSAWRSYQRSKLANILFTRELAAQLAGTGVTANCLHPGFVASKFGENNNPLMTLAMKFGKLFAISPEEGAKTSIYLAMSDDVEGQTGGYFVECKKRSPSRQAQNDATAQRLWVESMKRVGLSE